VLQSKIMKTNWAEENLQTIRTLMERSAVYRRALAPIMIFSGVLGVAAAIGGFYFHLNSTRAFGALWICTAVIAIAGAFLIARRQSLKDKEIFWSPPTRRVAQALFPPLLAGMTIGVSPALFPYADKDLNFCSVVVWMMFYGLALHAAGFFVLRGIKFLGWIFIWGSCILFYVFVFGVLRFNLNSHLLMGFFFGVLHLAYGAYLFLTEKKNPDA
jgi:hypothetical protein